MLAKASRCPWIVNGKYWSLEPTSLRLRMYLLLYVVNCECTWCVAFVYELVSHLLVYN